MIRIILLIIIGLIVPVIAYGVFYLIYNWFIVEVGYTAYQITNFWLGFVGFILVRWVVSR